MSRRVFISGATGFIGGRLAEVAGAKGDEVATIARTWSRAARLARLPARIIGGDLLDPQAVSQAMQATDVAFHCAVDHRAAGEAHVQAGVAAVENVMRAAHANGVRRVIHLSSVAVYGYRPAPDAATEDGKLAGPDDHYCRGKIETERAATRLSRALDIPLVVLRPTIVYGPFGGWTVDTLDRLRAGRQFIVDDGDGVCNTLYVDNLIDAMLRAAECEDAIGQTFHVSDASPNTWRAFIESHADAAAIDAATIPRCRRDEAAAAHLAAASLRRPMSSIRRGSELLRDPQFRAALSSVPLIDRSVRVTKRVASAVLPATTRTRIRRSLLGDGGTVSRAVHAFPSPAELDIYTTNVVFKIDKARRLLSYEPRIDFNEGMRRTRAWIQWARLSN